MSEKTIIAVHDGSGHGIEAHILPAGKYPHPEWGPYTRQAPQIQIRIVQPGNRRLASVDLDLVDAQFFGSDLFDAVATLRRGEQ
jgi:hypothetical protein